MPKKTVHFMEACWRDPQDKYTTMAPGFWRHLVEQVGGMEPEDLVVPHFGTTIEGHGGRDPRTSLDYVYIARSRSRLDRPHTKNSSGTYGSIEDGPDVNGIFEPAYGAASGTTNVAAFMRTSGAASWSGIEDWINGVLGPQPGDMKVALRAVINRDGFEELRRASGVARVHVRGKSDDLQDPDENGHIATAVHQAGQVAGGLSVDLVLSFGHAKPEDYSAEMLKEDLERFLRTGSHVKADATLMFEKPDGTQDRRTVDFVLNKVTTKERVDIVDDEPTEASVMLALQSAIMKYQNGEL